MAEIRINDNYARLPENYLFTEVGCRIKAFMCKHPDARIIRMGIGDVTRPVCKAAIDAMVKAVEDQGCSSTFHGYGPEQGYPFLREKIADHDYRSRGVSIDVDEIFISDGAKSDIGNICDIFSVDNKVAVTDPVYPVYVDSNVMSGRGGYLHNGMWTGIEYLSCNESNAFVPELPLHAPSIIYLCYPNNPTGTTLTRDQLKKWVDYARDNGALIFYDSAYEAYIRDPEVPHSIYEIDGARDVAIEFRSYSKTAGFTGVRCGYTVVPENLTGVDAEGVRHSLNKLWLRRQCTKFNGASYVAQRGAEALYTPEGIRQIHETIDYYMRNADILREGLTSLGIKVYGGVNAPYLWLRTPDAMGSWEFFDKLLTECHVAGTPGVGFGPEGEGYFRLTAFGSHEDTLEAVSRMCERLKV